MTQSDAPNEGREEKHNDTVFLEWIYERMICVHGEKDLYDYMINFKSIIDSYQSLRDQLSKEQEEKSKVLNAVKEVAAKGAEAKEQLEKEREMRKEFQVIAEEIVNESGFPGCNYTCSSHWRTEFKSILAKASELDKNIKDA